MRKLLSILFKYNIDHYVVYLFKYFRVCTYMMYKNIFTDPGIFFKVPLVCKKLYKQIYNNTSEN